jgi:hypothetical protein
MADTSAGEPSEEPSELEIASSTDEAVETVLEDELEIVDAGPECQDEPLAQPFHSTRAEAPGPRGCWAVARHGESCAAPAMRGHPYCAAHSGKGVSADPSRWSPIAREAKAERVAVRATIRAMYGANRNVGPRAVLRAHVDREAERLVGTAVNAALSKESDPLKAGSLALRLIETAHPPVQATVEFSKSLEDVTRADVDAMSYSELLAFARHAGMEIPEELPTPPRGASEEANPPPEP